MAGERLTIPLLQEKKKKGERIAMLTAYDYPGAQLVDEAGADVILVGDSVANVVYGFDSTLPASMEMMLAHTAAVARARPRALVVGDMPFLSYQCEVAEAIRNAGRFLRDGSADAVKLEGGLEVSETVQAIVRAGIPAMGHLGLTPQSVSKLGGYRVQGREADGARAIIEGACALEQAGAFALVLECVPAEVAELVTQRVRIPTIGIGAGPHCDGQVLVFHDVLGLYRRFTPKFVKRYAEAWDVLAGGLRRYCDDVRGGAFPAAEHAFQMKEGERKKIEG